MIQVFKLEDQNKVLVRFKFKQSGDYEVDGTPISVEVPYGKYVDITADSCDEIRKLDQTRVASHYENAAGDIKSVTMYDCEIQQLRAKHTGEDWHDIMEWDTPEDAANFARYVKEWNVVYRTVVVKSGPLPFEVKTTTLEKPHDFVSSSYCLGESDPLLFVYDRPAHLLHLVRDTMRELGLAFRDGCSYGETKNQKIWGNSTHSCIRYVTAFGAYVFDDSWDVRSKPRGTKDDMLAFAKRDETEIRRILRAQYAQHFGDEAPRSANILSALRTIQNCAAGVKTNAQSTREQLSHLRRAIDNKIQEIETWYAQHAPKGESE